MNKRTLIMTAVMSATLAAILLFVLRFALPASALGTEKAGGLLGIVAGWIKLASLLAATVYSARCVALLGAGNPARKPWLILAVALGFFSLGQATLTYYQTFRGISPFPSIADVWFLMSYPLLAIALVSFAITYARSGFPMGGLMPLAVMATIAAGGFGWLLLGPIAGTPAAPLTRALNLVYPALDLVLLVATLVLLRMTIRFRGGVVWQLWAALLSGFFFTAVGDIAFAYLSTLGIDKLDPLVHAMYLAAYASLAVGAGLQFRLLAPESARGGLVEAESVTT